MTRDDIIRMALKAGISVATSDNWIPIIGPAAIERFFALAYEAGAAAERDQMLSEGWRQCAQGQKTTQFCAVAEQARLEEREKFCAALRLLHDSYSLSSDAKGPDDANPSF